MIVIYYWKNSVVRRSDIVTIFLVLQKINEILHYLELAEGKSVFCSMDEIKFCCIV